MCFLIFGFPDKRWLLKNHLSSIVAITNASGTLTSQQRYLPFGGLRTDLPTPEYRISDTDYGYTGQRLLDAGLDGLMDYKARFYSPALGRFIQPDTIIPNPSNPQSWNRYNYGLNNPSRYTDPTGHRPVEGCGDDGTRACHASDDEIRLNNRRDADFRNETNRRKCEGGNKNYCGESTAKILGFTITALVGGAAAETAVLGGGAATALEAGFWRVAQSCAVSTACRWATGMAGGGSIWNRNPFERGRAIETQLGRSPQLAGNFPVIDRFNNGTATSIKSIDLTAQTYQNIPNLTNRIQSYGNTLAGWQGTGANGWDGVVIRNADILQRELQLAIPPNATQAQSVALQQLQTWAQSINIQLNIVVFP